jgi:transcription factor MYB, plant
MGRQPGTGGGGVQQKLRKGLWSPEEDEKLYNHIIRYGVGCWSSVPKLAGKHMRCYSPQELECSGLFHA